MNTQRGFTLIEVLVALVIMAVLASMAWQGIDGIVRSRDISQQHLERTLRLNTVLAQWEQDLLAVQDNPLVPALSFDGLTLRLVRQSEGGLQLVAWAVRNQRWLRWAGPTVTRASDLQDSWQRSQRLLGNEPGQLATIDGLSGWQVQFYRGNGWSNAQSSGDIVATASAASAPPREQLPAGVRIVLSFDGSQGTLTRDLRLGPQAP